MEKVSGVAKCKNFVIGGALAIASCLIWLVSACTQSTNNSVSIAPKVAGSMPINNSITATRSSNINKSTTAVTQVTTPSQTTNNSTPLGIPTTSNTLPDVPTPLTADNSISPNDIGSYLLVLDGLVNNPLSLSYAQIRSFPSVTSKVELICPGIEDDTEEWTGVQLSTLLNASGLMPEASDLVLTGMDGYSVKFPLEWLLNNGGFLAYQVNGQILPQWLGYPLRLVLNGSQGSDWVRWVTKIEVISSSISFSNSPSIIPQVSNNVPTSGSKLCSCLFSVMTSNYQVRPTEKSKSDENNSL